MKPVVYFTVLLFILLGTGGCSLFEFLDTHRTLSPIAVEAPAAEPAKEAAAVQDPLISPGPYLLKAQNHESKGEYQRALYYLNVAAAIDPAQGDIEERIARMQGIITVEADSSYQKGLTYYSKGNYESAKREWLLALKADPGHRQALDGLKTKLAARESISYTVEAGDTPEKISLKVYQTPQRGTVVSYFSGGDTGGGLAPGTVIDLPVLEPELVKPPQKPPEPVVDIKAEIARAETYLQEKRYDEVLQLAEKILDYDYLNRDAARLINAVYYEKGLAQYQQENYPGALRAFEKVDPQYRDAAAKVSEVKTLLNQRAEEHYLNGVKYFINEDLESAIKEWEITLSFNPDHAKAGSDIQDARNLLEKLGTVNQAPVQD